jgi:hypothetical protein
LLSVGKVTGDTETIYCGSAWVGVVLDIGSDLDRYLPSKNAVLFAGQAGQYFQFPKSGFSAEFYLVLQFLEIARMRSILADPF